MTEEAFWSWLQQQAQDRGLTLCALAKAAGLGVCTLTAGRRRQVVPQRSTCYRLAEVLAVDFEHVLELAGHTDEHPFWAWLHRQTAEQGLTMAHLSQAVGMYHHTLTQIHHRRVVPRRATCIRLAEVLGADPGHVLELAGYVEEKHPFWAWLHQQAAEQGLTIYSLATAAGLDRKTLLRTQQNGQVPTQRICYRLARILDADPARVLELAGYAADSPFWAWLHQQAWDRALTLSGLARAAGLGVSTLTQTYRTQGIPQRSTCYRLAQFLGVDLEYVLELAGYKEEHHFWTWLHREALQRDTSLYQIAAAVDVVPSALASCYQRGRVPDRTTCQRVAQFLQVDVAQVLALAGREQSGPDQFWAWLDQQLQSGSMTLQGLAAAAGLNQ
ncbi:MAG: hypothetical protein KKA73_01025, partial [Chloroflexi bacterium]|nr:hypothetical protein [Chloroflexota bacterium]MBU1746246.1 hypothetical protein [Chloroflexota bacterium]